MTQEEKDLLIKDLCARLPYGVFVKDTYNGHYGRMYKISQGRIYYVSKLNCNYLESQPCYIKVYLRPMSSMTEKEKEELRQEHIKDEKLFVECMTKACNGDYSMIEKVILHFAADWCNKNHFDFRGLIPMGWALEALEGMYNKKEK